MRREGPRRSIGRFARARSGAAGVEFALVMPILLFLMIGAIEIGRALHDYQVVNESVRDAARFLGRRPLTACPGADFFNDPDPANPIPNSRAAGKALVMTGSPDPSGSAPNLLDYWLYSDPANLADITATISCLDNGQADFQGMYLNSGWVPVIEVEAKVRTFSYIFGSFISPEVSPTLTLRHRVIGVGEVEEP